MRFLVLTLPLGLLSVLLGLESQPLQPSHIQTIDLVPAWESPWVARLTAPDPVVESIVNQYVQSLGNQGWMVPRQGVWLQIGNRPMAQHQGQVPLPAASLTKIATTLSALSTWEPDHQFETRVGMVGSLQDGVLNGDLVVLGGSDPLFVWEEGISLANALQQLGIQRITGDLVIAGDFTMNFEPDPQRSGEFLWQAFQADFWPSDAWEQYGKLPPDTPQPNLPIEGGVRWVPADAASSVDTWLITHQSLPLVAILKAMNIYSNNVMAEHIANMTGGAETVVANAVQTALVAPGELKLMNGSGLGTENQISPRAVAAMLSALQNKLRPYGFSVADVMPISGEDIGTLIDRRIPQKSAVKTGSLAEVSALAGVIPTRERGPVWFTIINWGWDLESLRTQQDGLLNAVQQHWGVADMPPDFQPKVRLGQAPYQLGNPQRNQPL